MKYRAAKVSGSETDSSVISGDLILNGLSSAVLVINDKRSIIKLNTAAEHFFKLSAANLIGMSLSDLIPDDSPMFALIEQVRIQKHTVSEYEIILETPRIGRQAVNIYAGPIVEKPDYLVLSIQLRSVAEKIDRQLSYRGAARSISAMASMLAHEVKNPLSGIRGAAQLLESTASKEDKNLTSLIRDEVDRICALVDRVGMFDENAQIAHKALNIHQILDHVIQISKAGFGHRSRFITRFDPSLPAVRGDRNQLVQVFLNLVKNAVEAASDEKANVSITSAYQHGVRIAASGSGERMHLPILISITDNGGGIPESILSHLFDPFVTSKPQGSGLGLALVAKVVGDHGGIVECQNYNSQTTFRVMLPVFKDTKRR